MLIDKAALKQAMAEGLGLREFSTGWQPEQGAMDIRQARLYVRSIWMATMQTGYPYDSSIAVANLHVGTDSKIYVAALINHSFRRDIYVPSLVSLPEYSDPVLEAARKMPLLPYVEGMPPGDGRRDISLDFTLHLGKVRTQIVLDFIKSDVGDIVDLCAALEETRELIGRMMLKGNTDGR